MKSAKPKQPNSCLLPGLPWHKKATYRNRPVVIKKKKRNSILLVSARYNFKFIEGLFGALIRFHFELSLPFCSLTGVCIWFGVKLIFFDKRYKWHVLPMSFPAVSTAAGFDNWLAVVDVSHSGGLECAFLQLSSCLSVSIFTQVQLTCVAGVG